MKSENINIILLGIIIYLLIKQNKDKKMTPEEMKRAEAIGMPKTIGELGTTF